MLSLSRRVGESIIIADNIEIVITSIGKEQVKVGIIAPREITVHRKEIYDLIQKENQEAKEASVNKLKQLGE